jgi:hypothetical protein
VLRGYKSVSESTPFCPPNKAQIEQQKASRPSVSQKFRSLWKSWSNWVYQSNIFFSLRQNVTRKHDWLRKLTGLYLDKSSSVYTTNRKSVQVCMTSFFSVSLTISQLVESPPKLESCTLNAARCTLLCGIILMVFNIIIWTFLLSIQPTMLDFIVTTNPAETSVSKYFCHIFGIMIKKQIHFCNTKDILLPPGPCVYEILNAKKTHGKT